MDAGLAGRRVLVTAGAAGIGLAIVERLLSHEARVFICDIDDAALHLFQQGQSDAGTIKADVSSESDVDRMFAAVRADWEASTPSLTMRELPGRPAAWRISIRPSGGAASTSISPANSCAPGARCRCSNQPAAAALLICHQPPAGTATRIRTPYSSAKFGIIGLTQSLAKELGPANIRVNAILPGIIEGPRMEGVIRDRAAQLDVGYDAMEKTYLERVSLRRMTSPHDVAAMIAFLISDAGANISGQSIGVDGNVETL